MFYDVLSSGGTMEYTKSQVYSLISQRIEQLQKKWFVNSDLDSITDGLLLDEPVKASRIKEIESVVDTLTSELNQLIDVDLINHWKRHFCYTIFPKNILFKKSLLHFFNPTMINALGMNHLGQAYMLTLLTENDKNDYNFLKNESKDFLYHINAMLDVPYSDKTINIFGNSIYQNYRDSFLELSDRFMYSNDSKIAYFFVHRKRFDHPLSTTDQNHPITLFTKFFHEALTPDIKENSLVSRFPETLENTLTLRNALFSMLFGNVDRFLNQLGTEINALPLGRSGFVIEEVVDSCSVELDHSFSALLFFDELTHDQLKERLSNHFSFMHDYLIGETILIDVAQDLFEKKMFGRSFGLVKRMDETYDLNKLFKDSYKLYIDQRFITPVTNKTS